MSGHHPITRSESKLPMFPALSRLERRAELHPSKYGREPMWRTVAPPANTVHIPSWNWQSIHELPPGAEALTLDQNGAYLAAIGHVTIAHAHLTPTGPVLEPIGPKEVMPGYYRIEPVVWNLTGRIVSPLGDHPHDGPIWIAHPTLVLLLELQEQGVIGGVTIIDSWTCRVKTDFLKWAQHMREIRTGILDALDTCSTDAAEEAVRDRYDRFKEGYSSALSMMLTGEKCKTRRPDWSHAVYATFAASMWVKAWRYTDTGHTLLAMGNVDTLTIIGEDLPEVMSMAKPPFRFDDTGRTLGALKTKAPDDTPPAPVRTSTVLPPLADGEPIL